MLQSLEAIESNSPMDLTKNLISARGVSMRFPIPKRYRELLFCPFRRRRVLTALKSVDLDIEKGDRIAVLGPNGAGKTTLLKLVGGLLLPTEGQIVVNGYDTLRHNAAARKSVGFVMNEERSFFWRLTARQNLEFFAALDNLSGKSMRERSKELVHFVGLEAHVDKPVSTYSAGMKQRLALARGLIAEPEVLILDEPTRALDPVACEDLIDLIIERLHKSFRKTLLIATHRLEEAMKLCNKALVLNEGRAPAFDRISDLTARGIKLET
jgi:ABC-2 type transport system ATP-binding protein